MPVTVHESDLEVYDSEVKDTTWLRRLNDSAFSWNTEAPDEGRIRVGLRKQEIR